MEKKFKNSRKETSLYECILTMFKFHTPHMTSAFKFLFIINFLKGNDLCNQNGYHRKEAVKKK